MGPGRVRHQGQYGEGRGQAVSGQVRSGRDLSGAPARGRRQKSGQGRHVKRHDQHHTQSRCTDRILKQGRAVALADRLNVFDDVHLRLTVFLLPLCSHIPNEV